LLWKGEKAEGRGPSGAFVPLLKKRDVLLGGEKRSPGKKVPSPKKREDKLQEGRPRCRECLKGWGEGAHEERGNAGEETASRVL